VVGAALFGWLFVADRQLGLAREQQFFIGGALVYSVGVLYFLRQQRVLQRLGRPAKALGVIAVESPLMLFFILFSPGIIPWRRSMLPYVAGSVLIAPLMILGVEWLFRSRV
jgi:hypothetical protein